MRFASVGLGLGTLGLGVWYIWGRRRHRLQSWPWLVLRGTTALPCTVSQAATLADTAELVVWLQHQPALVGSAGTTFRWRGAVQRGDIRESSARGVPGVLFGLQGMPSSSNSELCQELQAMLHAPGPLMSARVVGWGVSSKGSQRGDLPILTLARAKHAKRVGWPSASLGACLVRAGVAIPAGPGAEHSLPPEISTQHMRALEALESAAATAAQERAGLWSSPVAVEALEQRALAAHDGFVAHLCNPKRAAASQSWWRKATAWVSRRVRKSDSG